MKSPAFQFYPSDFLSDGNQLVMELDEAGAYIRLICVCWKEGHLPTDLRKLAKLCGATMKQMERIWPAIGVCFVPEDPGFITHPRLAKEREKQEAFREKARAAGKKSAEKRNAPSTPVEQSLDSGTKVDPTLQSSSSPSGTPTSTPTPTAAVGRVEKWEPSQPGVPKVYPPTIGGTASLAHDLLGMGLWGDELTQKFTDTKRLIRERWVASGVNLETVQAAIRGLRLLVDREAVEWLKDRKNKPLDGLHVLTKNAVAPGPDGTQMASLFALSERAWREHEQEADAHHVSRGNGLQRLRLLQEAKP